jgi:hypothetical protein
VYLTLNNNNLQGPIPEGLNLRNLFYLDLGNNNFTGPIPAEWWQSNNSLRDIRHLYLDNNALTGTLSADFISIGSNRLISLIIDGNQFTGEFPGSFNPTNFLQVLEIQDAGFTSMDQNLCAMSVFSSGEMTSFRSDCSICSCGGIYCTTPRCRVPTN